MTEPNLNAILSRLNTLEVGTITASPTENIKNNKVQTRKFQRHQMLVYLK